jgi:hypothetical protein
MRISVVLPIVAVLAATIGSSGQAFAKPVGMGGSQPQRPAPVVRDHRSTQSFGTTVRRPWSATTVRRLPR